MTDAAARAIDIPALPGATGVLNVLDEFVPPYAPWTRRVVASLLDGALGMGLAFLTINDPDGGLPFFGVQIAGSGSGAGSTSWVENGWLVAAVAAMVVVQAYLGVTPGKLVVGIAVVGERDFRPIGVVRSVLRELAHLIDAILLIGYLAPLWHVKKKTFADSLMGTVVLDTRRPRKYRWFARDAATESAFPAPWEAPSAPRWRPAATTLAAVACVLGLLFAYGPSSGRTSDLFGLTCLTTLGDDQAVHLTGGSLTADTGDSTVTRLWVTRPAASLAVEPVATWEWAAPAAAPAELTLRTSFARTDGAVARQFEFVAMSTDLNATMSLPADAMAGLGDSWTWTQTLVVDGLDASTCAASAPTRIG